jgi:hypothetical protein
MGGAQSGKAEAADRDKIPFPEKPSGALENFRIGREHIRTFLATCTDPEKAAKAKIQLAETEARIRDIEEGIRKLGKWIAEDEQNLKDT